MTGDFNGKIEKSSNQVVYSFGEKVVNVNGNR